MSDWIILTKEDDNLAEMLSELMHSDWAHVLCGLSESAKDELRAAVGTLIAESTKKRPGENG